MLRPPWRQAPNSGLFTFSTPGFMLVNFTSNCFKAASLMLLLLMASIRLTRPMAFLDAMGRVSSSSSKIRYFCLGNHSLGSQHKVFLSSELSTTQICHEISHFALIVKITITHGYLYFEKDAYGCIFDASLLKINHEIFHRHRKFSVDQGGQ